MVEVTPTWIFVGRNVQTKRAEVEPTPTHGSCLEGLGKKPGYCFQGMRWSQSQQSHGLCGTGSRLGYAFVPSQKAGAPENTGKGYPASDFVDGLRSMNITPLKFIKPTAWLMRFSGEGKSNNFLQLVWV